MDTQADLVVRDREELIYLLTEAAQFEHTVMCTYLYAQWSLKKDESEGITAEEKEAIDRWRAAIRSVARTVAPGGLLVLGFYERWGRLFHRLRRALGRLTAVGREQTDSGWLLKGAAHPRFQEAYAVGR